MFIEIGVVDEKDIVEYIVVFLLIDGFVDIVVDWYVLVVEVDVNGWWVLLIGVVGFKVE